MDPDAGTGRAEEIWLSDRHLGGSLSTLPPPSLTT